MENPFEFHEEDTIIACVGDNGGTTDEDIRNGFKRTVELLTESLKTGSEVEDLLVYPIVYNAGRDRADRQLPAGEEAPAHLRQVQSHHPGVRDRPVHSGLHGL